MHPDYVSVFLDGKIYGFYVWMSEKIILSVIDAQEFLRSPCKASEKVVYEHHL